MPVNFRQEIRILHIDDEPDFTEVSRTFLEREDDRFTVTTATSAEQGVKLIADRPPDCVISDYNMPGMDGLEFLQAVREEYPDLPFILFTGKGSEAVASDAISAGVTDYLQKQSGTEQYELLANRIRNAVQARREAQRAERREQLMRLTEFAGDTGGWELHRESETILLTAGTRRILGRPDQSRISVDDAIELFHPDDHEDIRHTLAKAFETGDQLDRTWRLQPADGDERLIAITITPVVENGKVTKLRGVGHDITERKEREQKLKRERDRISALFENMAEPIAYYEFEGDQPVVKELNPAFEEMFGVTDDEARGRPMDDMIVPAEYTEEGSRINDRVRAGEIVDTEVTRLAADGRRTFNLLSVPLAPDESGERGFAVYTDITERKQREEKLKQAQQRFQVLYEQLSQPVVEVEYEGAAPIVVDVNPAFEEVFGYDRDTIRGDSLDAYILPEDKQAEATEINQQIIDGRQPASKEVTRQTTTGPREFLLETALYDDIVGGFGIYTDITERKEQEHQLERKNARLAALFEQFPEPTLAYAYEDGEPYIRQVNEAFTETFGYDAEEAVGEHVDTLIVPPDRHPEAQRIDERVKAGDTIDETLRRRTQDEIREFRFRNIPLPDNDTIDGYAIYADVTERKLRERELQRKERIIQEMDDGVVVVQNQTITYTNPQVSEIVGYPQEDLVGEPMEQYIVPSDRETVRRRYKERVAGNDPPETYEISVQTREGETVPVEITAAQVSYGDEPATVSIVRDISDRKARIRELERKNERLEEFASIVSHDLRNPLNVAIGRLELARQDCESDYLADVARAHDRIEALIDDLLTLAREGKRVNEVESIALTEAVDNCWQTVETVEATLVRETDQSIRADPKRLHQVFENLFRNAVEHGDETATVRVGDLPDSDGFYVADDGPGIAAEHPDDVFEVGYSTSESGTGFGLNIVHEIVTAHGWNITVTDSEADGARFEITGVEFVE